MATLHDLDIGSEITLIFTVGTEEVELQSTLLAHLTTSRYGYAIQCTQPIKDGKYINCKKNLTRIEIKDKSTKRDYLFFKFLIAEITEPRSLIIASREDNKAVNNRNAFRVSCGYRAKIQCDKNKKVIDGYVHDLSYTGGSCIIKKDQKSPPVHAEISVSMWDEDDDQLRKLKGTVVRVDENFSDSYKLIGFTIPDYNSVSRIVANLQRKSLKVRGELEK